MRSRLFAAMTALLVAVPLALAAATWAPPRTAWGDPDLQGAYSNDNETGIPFERPAEFAGLAVPPVLLSGHHAAIARWRRREALARTLDRRPELLDDAQLDDDDRRLLQDLLEQRAKE